MPIGNSVHALTLDDNNDLYIGTGHDDLFRYDGTNFTRFKISPAGRIFPMDIHPDGTIYYFVQWGPQSYFKNDMIHVYDNYPGGNDANSSFSMSLVIHNSGNVWCDTGFIGYDAQPGCYIWDGTDWTYWKDLNTPFNPDSLEDPSIPSIGTQYSFERLIGEAPEWRYLDGFG